MAELQRPAPRPSLAERCTNWLNFVGSARLLSAAGSVLIVAAGCWWLLRTPTPPVEAGIPLAAGVTAPGSSTSAAPLSPPTSMPPPSTTAPVEIAPSATIVVQAAGAVAVPGVYSLPVGSRVHELIAAAGGAQPGADLDALALASVMVDGQRVIVAMVGDGAAPMEAPTPTLVGSGPPVGNGAGGGVARGPLDLNRATVDELDTLPGVGPATAAAIVAWRDANGPFASPDDLLEVRGIGPAKLDSIRSLVTT